MRATEFIRNILDIIDKIDTVKQSQPEVKKLPPEEGEDVANRFNSVFKMIQAKNAPTQYSNSPNEVVTGIDSVTIDAGGAQHRPEDVRGEHPRLYGGN